MIVYDGDVVDVRALDERVFPFRPIADFHPHIDVLGKRPVGGFSFTGNELILSAIAVEPGHRISQKVLKLLSNF